MNRPTHNVLTKLLEGSEKEPVRECCRIAQLWTEMMNASWTWIWLKNQLNNRWEVIGVDSKLPSRPDSYRADIPDEMNGDEPNIAELATIKKSPVFVADIKTFAESRNGKTYKVHNADWFEKKGISSFHTFPFFVKSESYNTVVQGVACCHFGKDNLRDNISGEMLSLMSKLTGQAVANVYEGVFFVINKKMNELANEYLTRVTKRPDLERKEYLKKIAELVKEQVHASAISVFYPEPLDRKLRCQYTTGMADNKDRTNNVGAKNPEEMLKYSYSDTEITSTTSVWKNSIPIYITDNERRAERKYIEYDQDLCVPVRGPTLIVPIASAASLANGTTAEGVLRCTGHTSFFDRGKQRNFDQLETYTIKFICDQMRPIMHTFASRISREYQISQTKHDIYAPINMVEGTVASIRKSYQSINDSLPENERIPDYRFLNLEMATEAMRHLTARLEADPREIRLHIEKTNIEGDIIAGMSAMLRHYAEKYEISIHFGKFNVFPPLFLDREVVGRVFYNLIINAIKYGRKGTEIRVDPKLLRDEYWITVSNYGDPIPPSDQERIFDAYFRSANAKFRMGSGLGLFISRCGMEQHGGKIQLISGTSPIVFAMIFPNKVRWHWQEEGVL